MTKITAILNRYDKQIPVQIMDAENGVALVETLDRTRPFPCLGLRSDPEDMPYGVIMANWARATRNELTEIKVWEN